MLSSLLFPGVARSPARKYISNNNVNHTLNTNTNTNSTNDHNNV